MDNKLPRTQLAFEKCETHLNESNSWGSEIESYLTQHLLVILCAEIQQALYTALENRASMASDDELKSFSVSAGKKILRSIGKSEIAGFLGHFSPKAKEYLNRNMEDREITLYNNAVSNRHEVAHNQGVTITFRELRDIVLAATKLISVVERAIATDRGDL